ncbi:MAG: hypothetical protein NC324_05380 [Bacteroides sp.]|nr:hypothetical protein [Bacteroides sp.]
MCNPDTPKLKHCHPHPSEDDNTRETREAFKRVEKLYHYTSVQAACLILSSNKLRFGALKKMNDINEVYRRKCYPERLSETNIEDKFEKELSKYKQLSFTQDTPQKAGYDIPAM